MKIRAFFTTGRAVGQFIGTAVMLAIGIAMLVFINRFTPAPPLQMRLIASASAFVAFASIIFQAVRLDHRWVELDGDKIRARHLYTAGVSEWSIAEIRGIAARGRKGTEILFKNRRRPIRVTYFDPAMTNADDLIRAVVERMGKHKAVIAEFFDPDEKTRIRFAYWSDGEPVAPADNNNRVVMGCLMATALLFGVVLTFAGAQDYEKQVVGDAPPHEMTLRSLIENGPGANRHVLLTGFVAGNPDADVKGDGWRDVWVPLFPTDSAGGEPREIRAVFASDSIADAEALRSALGGDRVAVMCSEKPKSDWGSTLGPNLVKANENRTLGSAWYLDDLRDPPSARGVNRDFTIATACFIFVVLLAVGLIAAGTR